ncbi:testin-like [Diaphorina citri]|uniref:Testin-like n=1 Tax=Diaphorina citri TaxID=121845 RepID=A0A3Q0JK25_DIACI|nr:testin-like [Diaphorina citri]
MFLFIGHPNGAPTSATVRVTNLDDLVDDLSRASVNGGRQNINGSVNGLTHGSGNGVTHGPCGNKLTQPRSGKTCKQCGQEVRSGDLAVYTEKLGDQVLWHPQCFVCSTCDELLVDLMYFHYKGNVYCLRDYATMLDIPRCHACDELIFVNEYTLAENKTFHVKHFCCYECDKVRNEY